jgi:hypothetical protein
MNCPTGKVEHQTVTAAQAHADSIQKKDGHLPNIYTCAECGYLHVGGGRASDRPIIRVQQQSTPWRDRVVKPSAGKTLTADDLILNELINTFKTDKVIAAELHISERVVNRIRAVLSIPRSTKRRDEMILKLLTADPKSPRSKIAKIVGCQVTAVETVAGANGFSGSSRGSTKGVNHPLYAQKVTPEGRVVRSVNMKRYWQEHPEDKARLAAQFTPEARAEGKIAARAEYAVKKRQRWLDKVRGTPEFSAKIKAGYTVAVRVELAKNARRMWADPEIRAKLTASLSTPEIIEKRRTPEARAKMTDATNMKHLLRRLRKRHFLNHFLERVNLHVANCS